MDRDVIVGASFEIGAIVWLAQCANSAQPRGRRIRAAIYGVAIAIAGIGYLTGMTAFAILGALLILPAFIHRLRERRTGS